MHRGGDNLTIICPSGVERDIVVRRVDEKVAMQDGWKEMLAAEGIVDNAIGAFFLVWDNCFLLIIYDDKAKVSKHLRPEDGALNELPSVDYELAGGATLTPTRAWLLVSSWLASSQVYQTKIDIIKVNQTHLDQGLYFNARFSKGLPVNKFVQMHVANTDLDTTSFDAVVLDLRVKVLRQSSGQAKLGKGWAEFKTLNNIKDQDVLAFRFYEIFADNWTAIVLKL